MNEDTKHVSPDAPRQLNDDPYSRGWKVTQKVTLTRGVPIEKLPDYPNANVPQTAIIARLNEIIERLNAMNEVSR